MLAAVSANTSGAGLTIRPSRPCFTAANFSGMFVLDCRRAAGRLNSGVRRHRKIVEMGNKRLALLSIAFGAAVLALATLPLPGAEYAFWPGQMLASLFWPEGIHSGNGGVSSAIASVLFAWASALVFWASLFFVATGLVRKARAA